MTTLGHATSGTFPAGGPASAGFAWAAPVAGQGGRWAGRPPHRLRSHRGGLRRRSRAPPAGAPGGASGRRAGPRRRDAVATAVLHEPLAEAVATSSREAMGGDPGASVTGSPAAKSWPIVACRRSPGSADVVPAVRPAASALALGADAMAAVQDVTACGASTAPGQGGRPRG